MLRPANCFDHDWYLQQNPDIAWTEIDPLTHYLQLGGFEGRDPNPLFDSDWYLKQYPDVARSGINPLVHYLRRGAPEGRDPHPLFDTDWYAKQNPELPKGVNPLVHYIARGATLGHSPSKLFGPALFLSPISQSETTTLICSRKRTSGTPKVSIVIPVFNKEPFISECLNSILEQTLREIEIICVNDGSDDDSPAILDAYYNKDDRITIIHNPRSYGAGIARNIGINCAEGEYLQFTDADDVLPPGAAEILYRTAKNDNVKAVRGNLAVFTDSSSTAQFQRSGAVDRLRSVDWTASDQLCMPLYHVTYLISRELVQKKELSYPDLIDGEDAVFTAKVLVNAKRVSAIPEIVYLRRLVAGARRTTLQHVIDFIRHAGMVRNIYMKFHAESWTGGYCPYLLGQFNELFLRNTPRTQLEQAIIALALKRSEILVGVRDAELPFAQDSDVF